MSWSAFETKQTDKQGNLVMTTERKQAALEREQPISAFKVLAFRNRGNQ